MMVLVSVLCLVGIARATIDTETTHVRSASRGLRRLDSIRWVAVGHVRVGGRRAGVRRRQWALKVRVRRLRDGTGGCAVHCVRLDGRAHGVLLGSSGRVHLLRLVVRGGTAHSVAVGGTAVRCAH